MGKVKGGEGKVPVVESKQLWQCAFWPICIICYDKWTIYSNLYTRYVFLNIVHCLTFPAFPSLHGKGLTGLQASALVMSSTRRPLFRHHPGDPKPDTPKNSCELTHLWGLQTPPKRNYRQVKSLSHLSHVSSCDCPFQKLHGHPNEGTIRLRRWWINMSI